METFSFDKEMAELDSIEKELLQEDIATQKDVTNIIERLESTEERNGIAIGGILAIIQQTGSLKISGEIIYNEAPKRDLDTTVHVVIYDENSRVGEKCQCYAGVADIPFDAFTLEVRCLIRDISKIRLYVSRDKG